MYQKGYYVEKDNELESQHLSSGRLLYQKFEGIIYGHSEDANRKKRKQKEKKDNTIECSVD